MRYFERGTNSSNQVVTKKTLTEIKGLKEATEYAFQVRAQTASGWGDFSRAVFKKTGLVTDPVFVGEDEGSQVSVACTLGKQYSLPIFRVSGGVGLLCYFAQTRNIKCRNLAHR